jgi:hypothetical protein
MPITFRSVTDDLAQLLWGFLPSNLGSVGSSISCMCFSRWRINFLVYYLAPFSSKNLQFWSIIKTFWPHN